MEATALYDQWRAAKSGVIDECDLVFIGEDRDGPGGRWFECPCGGEDHAARIPWVFEGFGRSLGVVLTCYITGQQWLIRRPNVADLIRAEEESYIKLLQKAPGIVRQVIRNRGWSEETKEFLLDTHGIDPEISQEIVNGTWPMGR